VLDVGTGSGYSAALLCEVVGSANVTSIDVGEEVVALARHRLTEAGYAPAVVCGDGFHGYAPHAPHDRIVSMVGLGRVPPAWVEQTRPGGVIVATLPRMTVRLQCREDGTAEVLFAASGSCGCAATHRSTSGTRCWCSSFTAPVRHGQPAWTWRPLVQGEAIPVFSGLATLLLFPTT
jgi:protein-L-isoaspartate(D-aspartate) O-methyltransferase